MAGRIASVIMLAASIFGFGNAAAETTPGNESVSQRPLVIAISGNYPPFSVTAPNGEHTGLLVEMWRLWSETTGTPVRFLASDWAGTMEAMRTGTADVHSGLFRNEERARWMDFSDPIHEIRTAVYFHAGRQDPVPLSKLAGRKVGVVRGSFQSRFVKKTYPDITVVDLKDSEAVMLALISDDVDAIIDEVPSTTIELARTGLYGAAVSSDEHLFTNSVHAGVGQGRADLVARIDAGFRAIPMARLVELERRWIPQEENRFYGGASGNVHLSAAEEAWLAAHPVIRFAVTNFITPVDIVGANGEYSGLNADLIAILNRKLGTNIVPEFHDSWGDVVKRTMAGEVDGAFSLSRTPERSQKIMFTRPYAFDPVIAVVRRENKDIASWEDLAGKTASVVRGASMIDDVRAALGNGTLIEVDDEISGLEQVAQGKADAHVSWLIPFGNSQRKDPVPGLRIAVTRNTEGGTLRIGIHKNRRELHSIIRKAFNAISREELNEIRNRWLYTERQGIAAAGVGLTAHEEAWLADHPTIRIGMMDDWPPISFTDEQGAPQGISAAYIEALNTRLGGVLQLEPGPWKQTYEAVKERRLDALLDITPKESREPFFNFTAPYLTVSHAIIAQTDAPHIASEADLGGKILALEKGFGNVRYFQENYPDVRVREYDDTLAALDAVARGEADAYAGNRAVATFLMEREIMHNLVPHGRLNKKPVTLAIGTREDWPVLRDILDKALASISADERHAIVGRWVKTGGPRTAGPRTIQLTDEEKAWIKAHPLISLAATPDWPPFEVHTENDTYEGVTADTVRLATERVGLLVEPIFDKWDAHLEALKNGEIDLAPGLFRTPDREKFLEYTRPFVEMYDVIITQTHRTDILSMGDLAGKTVTVERGYAQHEYLKAGYPETTILPVDNSLDALKAVALGKADAYVGNQVVTSYLIEANLLQNVKVAAFADTDATFLAMGVPKDRAILRDIMDKALASITPDERKAIIGAHVSVGRSATSRRVPLTDEERAWIRNHPKIRVHNEIDWPPFNYNEDGVPKGFSIAYMDLLAERLGITVEYVSGPTWAKFLDMIRGKDMDVMLNIIQTEERGKYITFTQPYIESPPVIIARQQDATIQGFEDLFDKKVAIPKGFYYQELIERDFPQIELVLLGDQAECLKAVAFGRADATLGEIATQTYLIRKNLLTNLRIVGGVPEETFVNRLRIGVRDDWPLLRDLLQKAIDTVTEKEMTDLQNRWLGGVTLDKKKIALTDAERFWIVENPTIRIAATPDWPPFEFRTEDGAYTGISADVIRAAAEKAGLKTEIVFDEWEALLDRLKRKDLDVAPGLNRTPEREEYLLFTEPFVEQYSAIFVEEGTTGIKRIKDLEDKTVAVEKGYALAEILGNEYPEIELLPVDNALAALQAVSTNDADAYVGNQVVAAYLIKKNMITNLNAVGVFGEQPGRLRFGVRTDLPILRDILEKALSTMSDRERNDIIARYVDVDSAIKQQVVAISDTERAWLREHREIRMAVNKAWPPIEFFDERDRHSGIASGFVKAIRGALAVRTVPVRELDWGTPLVRLGTGDIDFLPAVIPSKAGEANAAFTKPYLSFPVVVVVRDDFPFITDLADLQGKKVGAIVGSETLKRLLNNHADLDLEPQGSVAEALKAVSVGGLDAFVDNVAVVSYGIDSLGLSNLKVGAPTPYTDDVAMAVRKDWPQLLLLLDKALDAMTGAEKTAIKNEWIAIEYELGLDWWTVFKWAAPVAAGGLIIIIVVVTWNRRLGSEIAERKRAETALAESEERTRLLLESVGEGVFGVDLRGRITFVNPAALLMLGHDRDEMTGKDAHTLIHHTRAGGEHYPIEECPMWRAYTTGESTSADDEMLWCKDGTGFSARYNSTPIVRGGEIVGAVISFMDITERKKAERALAESEERTRLLLESVGEGVFGVDLQGRITFVNPPALAMLEFEHDELVGNGAHALFHYYRADGSHYPVEECPMYRAFTFGESSRIDDEVLWRKGGTCFPVEYNATPIMREGEKVGAVISFTDITERKEAEEKVRKILGDLNAVMEAIDYGILFMDSRLRAQLINRAFMEIWGIDQELVAEGPTLADLMYHNQDKGLYDVGDGDFDWYVEERVSAVHAGSIAPTEIRRADGIHLRFQCIALPDGGRMMTYFDITEMKEKEAELARQKEIVDRTLGNLDQGIIMVDRNMCVVSRNARFAEMFTIPDEWFEPPANYHQIIRHRLERREFDQELYDGMVADTRRREFFSVERPQADGGVVEMRHIPLDDGGFVRSFTDITERKMAEEAIRLGGERLELALKGGDMGSWDIDLRKSTTVVNPRWWEMLGFAVDEVDNPRIVWRGTMHPDDSDRVIEVGRAYRAGSIPSYEVEYRVITKQGETRWIVSKGATVGTDEDGSPLRMVGTVMDITERKEAERQLTAAYEIITSSIHYASRIQRSILPPDKAIRSVFSDYFVLWEPRDVVGGDVYWCTTWGPGVLLILADCTGHGVPGAFMTLISTGALDRAQTEVPEGDVPALVQRMHQLVQTMLGQDGDRGESDDGLELGACYLTPGRATLEFVGARFSLFIAENGEVTELKGVKKGLGYRGVPLEQTYPGETVELRPGMGFYMTSDGLIDQIGGEKHRSFGKRRFRDLIVSVQELPLAEQRDRIVETLQTYQGGEERRDDVSVIGFTID